MNDPILVDASHTREQFRSALNDSVLTDIDETLIRLKLHVALDDVLFGESRCVLLFRPF